MEQQPRQRTRQRGQTTMQARQAQVDEVRQWERDWREGITGQVRDIADNTTKMSLVVREMQGDVRDLMEWKDDVQKRRNDGIDRAPDERRANLAILISAFMAAIYLFTLISQHWRP